MRVVLLGVLVVLSGWVLPACRSESKLAQSKKEDPKALHPERASQRDELLRILRLPIRDAAAWVGPFQITETSALTVTLDQQTVESLDESFRLELDKKGHWHALHDNSKDYGVEAWWLGDQLGIRMRYGKPVFRRPESGETDRLLSQMSSTPASYYQLVERFADLKDEGEVAWEGRSARRIRFALAQAPAAARQETKGASWRAHVVVSRLSGGALIDGKTGVLLALDLNARYRYPRGESQPEVTLQLKRGLHFAPAEAIAPPSDAIPSPLRTRYEVEKRELLGDLIPGR